MTEKILGYRELSQEETELINEIKTQGDNLGLALDAMAAMPDVDKRWLAIGRTHLQEGLMALVRSIAKPTSF